MKVFTSIEKESSTFCVYFIPLLLALFYFQKSQFW